MRIGYSLADSLITYPRVHNLSACELPFANGLRLPNFARNSPEGVVKHALKTAEYQRFDFKV